MLKKNIHRIVERVEKKWYKKKLTLKKRNKLINQIDKINKKEVGYSILVQEHNNCLAIKKIKQED
jgi:hypothetical protein